MNTSKRISFGLIAITALVGIFDVPLNCYAAGEKKLEVFSWWTSGGEAVALDALFKVYKKQYPGVEIINATVAGGGGSAARPVLQTRLAGGNPPDTWQSHPGWEMLGQYVDPGYCDEITELYKTGGWDKAFPKALVDLMTKDGKTYGVLAGVHRGSGHILRRRRQNSELPRPCPISSRRHQACWSLF
jgi:glucose/mannose transport system substrate-binding protein